MTKEQFEKAEELKQRIGRINKLIEGLTIHQYEQNPPTRSTSWELVRNSTSGDLRFNLNEGEVITILEAFKSEKVLLERLFERL